MNNQIKEAVISFVQDMLNEVTFQPGKKGSAKMSKSKHKGMSKKNAVIASHANARNNRINQDYAEERKEHGNKSRSERLAANMQKSGENAVESMMDARKKARGG